MGILTVIILLFAGGCKKETGPDLTGKITLSSQLHGTATEGFYLYGYAFEPGEMYAYPRAGEPLPDIIIERYPGGEGEEEITLPGFNTPGFINGFALLASFATWEEALAYYNDYEKVQEGLVYKSDSDIVEAYQVWVQKTSSNKYVKMLIKDVQQFESEAGDPYNEVTLEYTYAADGAMEF